MLPAQLQLKLLPAQANDFQQFLLHHRRVSSFQKIGDKFSVNLVSQNQEEYTALLQGIKEIYQIENLKEIKFCQAKCSNGTDCLNQARYENFCWKHQKRNS